MSYLQDYLKVPMNRFEENQKQRSVELINEFTSKATVFDGVVRWNSNGNVPPTEILDLWRYANLVFDYDKSMKAKDIDNENFIAEYKERQANRKYTNEELFEMRCSFGEGATVVDVISGNKITL